MTAWEKLSPRSVALKMGDGSQAQEREQPLAPPREPSEGTRGLYPGENDFKLVASAELGDPTSVLLDRCDTSHTCRLLHVR